MIYGLIIGLVVVCAFLIVLAVWKNNPQDIAIGKMVYIQDGFNVNDQRMDSEPPFPKEMNVKGTVLAEGKRKVVFLVELTNMGTGEKYTFEVRNHLKIGRRTAPKQDRQFLSLKNDQHISREHCMLYVENGELYIQDLHSTGHTFLNNTMVNIVAKVDNGDILGIGYTLLKIQYRIQ